MLTIAILAHTWTYKRDDYTRAHNIMSHSLQDANSAQSSAVHCVWQAFVCHLAGFQISISQ